MKGRVGENCQQSGIYKCQKHPGKTIPLSIGEKFPECSFGKDHIAVWVLVVKVSGDVKTSKNILF